MSAGPQWRLREYADADALAAAVAEHAQDALGHALAHGNVATLVVSGGSTPLRYFPRIAACVLDWSRVSVTLADERWVDPDDAASNERLVREHLLQGPASAARFVALKNAAPTPHAGCPSAAAALAALAHPYDLVILGMGDDGHIASLFPGAPELAAGLDPRSTARCVGISPPAYARPAVPRISMTLRELLDARKLVLALQGAAKRAALEQALAHGDPLRAPVCALFSGAQAGPGILWAP